MRILVGYATANGSTRGIAERIAAQLGGAGVDVCSLADVESVSRYGAVVVGSAIHNGQWLPDAAAAIERFASAAADLEVWAFSVSSVGATSTFLSPRLARRIRRMMPEPRAVQRLRSKADVSDHRFFAGSIKPGDWPGFGRFAFRLMGGRYGDARDWADIDGWASAIRDDIARLDHSPR